MDFNKIEPLDFPLCDEEAGNVFAYIDFSSQQSTFFEQIGDDMQRQLRSCDTQEMLHPYSLPIRGTIAAGNLRYVNEEYGKKAIVPTELVRTPESKFVLEVSGDSMLDFGILDGDFLIIQSQAIAADGSIVVGGSRSRDEATVKQFQYDRKNQMVILHPGNQKYEDITIPAEDFYMNGIVVGMIRKK